jgi:hypothetical protein
VVPLRSFLPTSGTERRLCRDNKNNNNISLWRKSYPSRSSMSTTTNRATHSKPPGPEMMDNRVFPSASTDRSDRGSGSYDRDDSVYQRRQISRSEEEGVEVVLGGNGGNPKIVDQLSPHVRPTPDQNVFRPPRPVRPRAMRAHGAPPPPPHLHGSGSYSYGPPPSHEYGHRPYPVPYNPSGSFDEPPHPYHTQSQYSPHIQYPPPGARHAPEDVNVISPNHKVEHSLAPHQGRSRHGPPGYYNYPPTSPVSRAGGGHSPPRLRNYAMRREGPYSAAQRGRRHPEDGTWNPLPVTSSGGGDRAQPPLVTESFDSDHYSSHQSHGSHPTTPSAPHTPHTPHHHHGPPVHGPPGHDPRHHGFYGGGSFGSFDSHAPPPPHFDDYRYYGHPPPESPHSHYSYQGYSPGGYYDHHSPHSEYGRPPHSYEEDEHGMKDDHQHNPITPNDGKGSGHHSGMVLPKAAQEIDFDVTDPPLEPITPPSKIPLCESPADINSYDVLCGRGGGTNSQIGNRRFRKLVQEFQPTYLLARRKEKPLLARTIVLIIRKRGGRFLKKDEETGELFEVGDGKAEAKTSQALREGLDVRATKTEAKSLMDKKKKKGGKSKDDSDADDDDACDSPASSPARPKAEPSKPSPPESPPTLPRLQGEEQRESNTRPPHSPTPESLQFRKRRRMRSGDNSGSSSGGCFQDKLFSEFCPPRADLARAGSPILGEASSMDLINTPQRRNARYDDDDIRYDGETPNSSSGCGTGCAGIALDMVTGAAAGSFCLGPRKWL